MEWISVKDELPQERDVCLVCTTDSRIALGNFERDLTGITGQWYVQPFLTAWYRTQNGVTHWKPLQLPESPKRKLPFSYDTVEDGYVIYRHGTKLTPWYLVDSLNGDPFDLLKFLWGVGYND